MSKVLVDTCSGERNWFWIWINPAPLEANDEGRPGDFQLREPLQSKAQQVLLFSKIVVASKFSRVPDAVQRSPVDANGSRDVRPMTGSASSGHAAPRRWRAGSGLARFESPPNRRLQAAKPDNRHFRD